MAKESKADQEKRIARSYRFLEETAMQLNAICAITREHQIAFVERAIKEQIKNALHGLSAEAQRTFAYLTHDE